MSLKLPVLFRGIFFFTFFINLSVQGFSQSYPKWFSNQSDLNCKTTVVGYAHPSFFPDSSASQAIKNGFEIFARQKYTHISGGQAFWSTEIGSFWMGSDYQEQFDTSYVNIAKSHLNPLDTLFTKKMTVVLLGNSDCSIDENLKFRVRFQNTVPPKWIESPPKDDNYFYAVGVSPEYYYEISSWKEAEKLARRNLARSIYIEIKSLQKKSQQFQEITDEKLEMDLYNIQVVARWRDVIEKIFYVLIRKPKILN